MSLPKRYHTSVRLIVPLALVAAGFYFAFRKGDPEEPRVGGGNPQLTAPAAEPEPGDPAGTEPLPLTVLNDAPFAQEFGLEATTPARELELVQLAFSDYLSFVKEHYRKPFGYHEELVAVLVGENPLRLAPVPPGHPRIDDQGRLTDHWGTPFDIHPLSSTAIEIRSAGPDKQMNTADDLHNVTSSGQDILDAMAPVADRRSDGGSGAAAAGRSGGRGAE